LDGFPAAFVHRDSDHGEALRPVGLLELRKPRDLLFAAGAPRGPEVQQNHFAAKLLQGYGLAGAVLENPLRRGLALVGGLQDRADGRLIGGQDRSGQRDKQDGSSSGKSEHGLILLGEIGYGAGSRSERDTSRARKPRLAAVGSA